MAHMDEMDMYIHRYPDGVIEEFDSIEELREFDDAYVEHSGSKILEEVCKELKCLESEIKEISPVKQDGEMTGFQFLYDNQGYQYYFNAGLSKEENVK